MIISDVLYLVALFAVPVVFIIAIITSYKENEKQFSFEKLRLPVKLYVNDILIEERLVDFTYSNEELHLVAPQTFTGLKLGVCEFYVLFKGEWSFINKTTYDTHMCSFLFENALEVTQTVTLYPSFTRSD